MRHFLIWFYLLLLNSLQAQDWYRGAFLILDQAGEVEVLDHLGAMDVASPESMVRPGNAAIDAAAGGELLILNSNKVVMAFEGAGKLSYERFEQAMDASMHTDFASGKSRMILELKIGRLLIDSSQYAADAHIMLETPFGRLTLSKKSLFSILISENKKRKRFNFEIECSKGNAGFLDQNGHHYELYRGQRLSGYSKEGSLTLGFSQGSYSSRSIFKQYNERLPSFDLAQFDYNTFKPHMKLLLGKDPDKNNLLEASGSIPRSKRPIVIDVAPRPDPTLPIRAIKK